MKKGDKALLVGAPFKDEYNVVIIKAVKPPHHWGFHYDYLTSDEAGNYPTYVNEKELIPIPKDATKDQIEAIKSLIA